MKKEKKRFENEKTLENLNEKCKKSDLILNFKKLSKIWMDIKNTRTISKKEKKNSNRILKKISRKFG